MNWTKTLHRTRVETFIRHGWRPLMWCHIKESATEGLGSVNQTQSYMPHSLISRWSENTCVGLPLVGHLKPLSSIYNPIERMNVRIVCSAIHRCYVYLLNVKFVCFIYVETLRYFMFLFVFVFFHSDNIVVTVWLHLGKKKQTQQHLVRLGKVRKR